jgi:hypothetical protein
MEELKDDIKRVHEEIERQSLFVQTITNEVGKVTVGQKYAPDRLLVGSMANGHVLSEDVPGTIVIVGWSPSEFHGSPIEYAVFGYGRHTAEPIPRGGDYVVLHN